MKNDLISINENAFLFKREANFLERQTIQNEMSTIAGGLDKLTELDTLAGDLYRKHLEFNKSKLGDKFEDVIAIADKPFADCSPEEKKIRRDFYDNKFYYQCSIVTEKKRYIEDVATLKVLCMKKPENYDFFMQKDSDLRKLIEEVKKENVFFRTEE